MDARLIRLLVVVASAATPLTLAAATSCGGDDAGSGAAQTSTTGGNGHGGSSGVGGATGGTTQSQGGNGAIGGMGSSSSGYGGYPVEEALCSGKLYECGDLLDNDEDGLIDWEDPDCLGSCDNTEDSYYPDLPGMTGGPCKVDCFWDNGNGSGDDECYWDHHCDPLEVGPDFPPEADCPFDDTEDVGPFTCEEAFNEQLPECYDACLPLVPNGCDCFGCCELPAESGNYVWLQSYDEDKNGTCTLAAVNDPSLCHPCTYVPGCFNGCGRCELCMGKTTVPADCFPDGGTGTGGSGGGSSSGQCDPGMQPCGLPGQDICPQGYYCITGCCVELPT
jgi:hypothetical protein